LERGEQNMTKVKEIYVARIRCPNCGERKDVEIPKGTTIAAFVAGTREIGDWIICDFCGCRIR